MAKPVVIVLSIIALNVFYTAFAFGPIPLQDFCVADPTSSTRVNGLPCKDPATVQADDFFFSGLHLPGNTTNPFGAALTPVTVTQVPGLNTLGLSIARLDFAASGFIPPHTHPRATEILVVLEGSLEVGFITTNPGYKNFNKVLEKGDVFVVPLGLVHYQRSVGTGNTVAIAALNGQNPGIIAVPSAVFGAEPAINSDYLAKAFLLDKKIVEELQAKF
ncbi:putative germin-like protein 2-3 [Sesamum alatum]|uniref:Germin-like protein n=1 Tax=Sesamum alatum TaxID=300844 RepID=A0AAE1XKG1_9LAMI|nr:putative germin-like protein 2-3 [Sesamum alatum]